MLLYNDPATTAIYTTDTLTMRRAIPYVEENGTASLKDEVLPEIPPSRCSVLFRPCHPERSRNPSIARIKRSEASFGISDEKVRFRFAPLGMTRTGYKSFDVITIEA